jgi:predicted ATPase
MITKMHIENFKCFKQFDIDLGPFNVLIGPNDSGKSAFLQAIGVLPAVFETEDLSAEMISAVLEIDLGANLMWKGQEGPGALIRAGVTTGDSSSDVEVGYANGTFSAKRLLAAPGTLSDPETARRRIAGLLGKVAYYRFIPNRLREPSNRSGRAFVYVSGTIEHPLAPTGEGFPTFLEDFLREDRTGFAKMEEEFSRRFPGYQIKLPKHGPSRESDALEFQTPDGQVLPSVNVSDGTVLYLAYLALCFGPNPPGILLIEEPENGVHHASLMEIVRVLRHITQTKGVQVVLTTHSPYLLDLVEPEEVRVFRKDQDGAVHAKKLSDYEDVEDMKKHFMSGEIWTMLSKTEAI